MAQLPPKAPTMAQKWPEFGYQTQSNNWINDFTGFSSAKRISHRRSGSDPVAFVESPLTNDCINDGDNAFERLDDEQLCSMFSDEFAANVCDNEERKVTARMKSEPVEDGGDGDREPESGECRVGFSGDGGTIVDPKRVKRILANRQSAQRSRIRKLHYISELERSVTTLQTEVSTLSPRVAFLDHQRLILNVDNSSLKQRIAALAQDKIFKDAHQEALKKELERLRRVYHEQNMNKTDNMTTTATTTTTTTTTGSPMGSPMTSPSLPPPPSSLNGTDG